MDREVLRHHLERGLSLPQIGALVGRDPSTVGYWVKKHSLVANGKTRYAPRGGLSRELEPLVERGMTLTEIAAELDRSPRTVRYWLDRLGLRTLNGRGPRPRPRPGPVDIEQVCESHGSTTFFLRRSEGTYHCKRCRAEAVARRRRKVKEILVAEAGGCCRLCGYGRFPAALQFHHLDPATKQFGLARKGITQAIDKLRAEAAKCVLLCANCHAEVEGGFAKLP